MKNFLIQTNLFLLPIYLVVASYFVMDPFKVLYEYPDNYICNGVNPVQINYGHAAIKTYLHNISTQHYDSFIFGSSRTRCYRVEDWQKHIGSQTNCFHMDANGESIFGMCKRVEFVSKHTPIKHALIVIDYSVLNMITKNEGHLYAQSPELLGCTYIYTFQKMYLSQYLKSPFFLGYWTYLLNLDKNHRFKAINYAGQMKWDPKTNEHIWVSADQSIDNGTHYTEEFVKKTFTVSEQTIDTPCIEEEQKKFLTQIAEILKQQKTAYKIIISPLFDKRKINPQDLEYLNNLFGKENVFDFSGKNKITVDYHNFYENSHYRPHVATMLMNIVYEKDVEKQKQMMQELQIE